MACISQIACDAFNGSKYSGMAERTHAHVYGLGQYRETKTRTQGNAVGYLGIVSRGRINSRVITITADREGSVWLEGGGAGQSDGVAKWLRS